MFRLIVNHLKTISKICLCFNIFLVQGGCICWGKCWKYGLGVFGSSSLISVRHLRLLTDMDSGRSIFFSLSSSSKKHPVVLHIEKYDILTFSLDIHISPLKRYLILKWNKQTSNDTPALKCTQPTFSPDILRRVKLCDDKKFNSGKI